MPWVGRAASVTGAGRQLHPPCSVSLPAAISRGAGELVLIAPGTDGVTWPVTGGALLRGVAITIINRLPLVAATARARVVQLLRRLLPGAPAAPGGSAAALGWLCAPVYWRAWPGTGPGLRGRVGRARRSALVPSMRTLSPRSMAMLLSLPPTQDWALATGAVQGLRWGRIAVTPLVAAG